MTRTSIVFAATLLAATALTPTLALAQFSEPAAFQAANPNRDVLNGGQLTPAGRAALGQPPFEGANAFASQRFVSPGAPVVHSRRHRR
jgi:hypothetical protein